jgi:predicted dehydrogenase
MFFYNDTQSRRKFLANLGITGLSLPFLFSQCNSENENTKSQEQANRNKQAGKLGIALVGLGNYATTQLAPALQRTEHCYLAGIVTGTPSKAEEWKKKYLIPEKNIYNYGTFDSIKGNPDIDIVYVVLPNNMHAEYTIRAAQAGKHVISEKPMAISVEECDKMIAACKQAGKLLSVGYRLHFDPYNHEMIRLAKEKVYGDLVKLRTAFSITTEKGIWRLDKKMAGGGPMMDVGIYCLQAVCYMTGMDPVAVTAQTFPISDKTKFIDVEETVNFQVEMPNGIVGECRASYSEEDCFLRADAERGWFELRPSFYYVDNAGITSDNKPIKYSGFSQQASQMDSFALSIKNKTPSVVPGEMGRRDLKVIEAVYEAMQTGKRVEIAKG